MIGLSKAGVGLEVGGAVGLGVGGRVIRVG